MKDDDGSMFAVLSHQNGWANCNKIEDTNRLITWIKMKNNFVSQVQFSWQNNARKTTGDR